MPSELRTVAEQSGFRHTGRTDEVERLAAAFAANYPAEVRSFEYGRSAEGRPMRALLVTRTGALDAAAIRQRGIPLLMLQAGIHPGESDGKDAGFIALRELLDPADRVSYPPPAANAAAAVLAATAAAAQPDLLQRIAILFVPAFNTDGHERVGAWNRPNQVGPEEPGWRTTAHNLNLNRDYTKTEAPEMAALLRLVAEWDPLIVADLHVTDGADFEPDMSIQVEPINQGDTDLRRAGVTMRDGVIAKLEAQGSIALPFYPDFAETDDPSSGFVLTVYSPRFSTGYFPQRNRFTVLVETHSWKPYAHRVKITRNTIVGLAELTAQHGKAWLAAARAADETATQLAGEELVLDYESSWREPSKAGKAVTTATATEARTIEFRGYAYTRDRSELSGAPVTVYDPTTPQIWRVPYRDRVQPSITAIVPARGYVVPVGYAELVASKLTPHGIAFERLAKPEDGARVEAFHASQVRFSSSPFEGRMRATVQGEWRGESHDLESGALVVPTSQPLTRLVVALLEPRAPDSLLAWGFFNAHFEQKEQLEPYVAEQIAREMAKTQPALAEEFKRKLRDDPALAADPAARLEFFLRRHASWDARYNVYPILRL
jgi:murein tripeptide amidase MpaA